MEKKLSPNKIKKREVIDKITEKFSNCKGIVVTDYRGLTVEQIAGLRAKLREQGVEYKIFKNTFCGFAADNVKWDASIKDYFKGPSAIAFGYDDPVTPVKIITEYIKENKKTVLKIKGGCIEGKVVDATELKEVAKLPSREQLLGQVAGTLQAPISGFARVLAANISGLMNTLNAIREQKEA